MVYKFSKELYSKEAMLKAAYSFTDRFYIHLSVDDDNYLVELEPKCSDSTLPIEEFKNEILAQEVRKVINEQTHNLRMLIMARAFSSSLIAENDDILPENNEEFELDDIMKDWFSEND